MDYTHVTFNRCSKFQILIIMRLLAGSTFRLNNQSKIIASILLKRNIYLSPCREVRQDENFTFDWDKVPSTSEKEREKFSDYLDIFGETRFSKPIEYQNRQYTTSADPEEWSYVARYMNQCSSKTIPLPNSSQNLSSGFVMPTAKPGDHPYFVKRAPSWLFPVYVTQSEGRGLQRQPVLTTIKRVEGNVAKLCEDLSDFLMERYEQEFTSQPNELMQKVVFRGNFDQDFKEFLKMKGF